MDKAFFEEIFKRNEARFIEEWKELLRFKSISADPAFSADCLACAQWLAARFERQGIKSELLQTGGKPVVYGEYQGKAGAPTVVFYGHYDVQPVDPLDKWLSPPFEPQLRQGRMYARGAQDNKGQLLYVLQAVESLAAAGALNCSIRFFIEGEEECGSAGISAALAGWKEKLKGDVLMVCDTGMPEEGKPAITMGLRGMVYLTVELSGASHDLHSGVHGGVAPNPALEMCRLLSSLHHADGSIAVEGYYDSIEAPSAGDLQLAARDDVDPLRYEREIGVAPLGGERERKIFERRGFRPTIEINGIHSGYGGPGSKTVIASSALAKISSRLVPGQDPEKQLALLVSHLKKNTPQGLQLEISEVGAGGPALRIDAGSALVQRAREVLESLSSKGVAYLWEGGSIPVVSRMAKVCGAQPLLVGFGIDEDNVHAPNESFGLDRFRQGFLYACMLLSEF